MDADTLINALRLKGYRITPQRRAIIDLLVTDDSHPTADELYQRLLHTMPDISRTTIYNTLHQLVALGKLKQVADRGSNSVRFDANTKSHHHLFCLRCQSIRDIHAEFPAIEIAAEDIEGFQIVEKQITFYGVCPRCR
jgi:Fe2+ or Zn2+ uptake regulation protein